MDSLSSDLMDLSTLLRQVLRYRIAEQTNKVIRKRNVYIAAWSRGRNGNYPFSRAHFGSTCDQSPRKTRNLGYVLGLVLFAVRLENNRNLREIIAPLWGTATGRCPFSVQHCKGHLFEEVGAANAT